MMRWLHTRVSREEGTALIETALTLPLLLFISVAIIEFGRAYQTYEVLTNAAREGARVAVLPDTPTDAVTTRVQDYLQAGAIDNPSSAKIVINRDTSVSIGTGGTASASSVEVDYPYTFMVLQPVAQLVVRGSTAGAPITMSAAAVMRNE